MMRDILNADWFELIIALMALVFLLLLCFLFSQLYSTKKEKHESLVERTMQKRNAFRETHPDWGKQQHYNGGINQKDRDDETNATKRKPHKADSEQTNNPVEDYDVDSNQQTNVIVWDNLESSPTDSNSTNKSESDKDDDFIESKYKYMQAAVEGRFLKLLPSEEKCFFRTWEEHGERKYEFYGNVNKALANINAIFDDVCEIEGKQNGATNIENLAPGILDENFKIIKKAIIKLI